MRYVFIVTYGKSGSTLLMDALNTIPGWHLRGENGGSVYDLYRHYKTLTRWQDHWADNAPLPPSNPWFGIDEYPRHRAREMLRNLIYTTILRPPPTARVAGFKEIRWNHHDLHAYLDWIEAVFPDTRFIGNVRQVDDTIQSGWWKKTPNARELVTGFDTQVREAITSRGDNGYLVDYTEYGHNPAALAGLFQWLGEEFHPDRVSVAFRRSHGTDSASGGPYNRRHH